MIQKRNPVVTHQGASYRDDKFNLSLQFTSQFFKKKKEKTIATPDNIPNITGGNKIIIHTVDKASVGKEKNGGITTAIKSFSEKNYSAEIRIHVPLNSNPST